MSARKKAVTATAPAPSPSRIVSGAELPHVMTVPEVAEVIGFTPKGVYSLVEQRRIPFVKISNRVRFLRDDVVAWLRESRVPPTSPER